MCIGYELNGKKIDYFPSGNDDQLRIKPIYKNFKGWKKSISKIKKYQDLPDLTKEYISYLEKFICCKISSISTSPNREDTILIEDPFKV